ncbi:TATA box-binding protein-associated factor RNA polymerase I subunit B isoform 1-T1 [Pholidichthys leucotaenia]
MDDEDTVSFRDPCVQCSAVDWGISDEGRFFCRSCHNVIERTREVVDTSFLFSSNKISSIGTGPTTTTTTAERSVSWLACEGFQFILKNQADALLRLGVRPDFKDGVLCPLWRRFLQKSRQAFTHNPVRSTAFTASGMEPEVESGTDSVWSLDALSDGESNLSSSAADSRSDWSESSDAPSSQRRGRRRRRGVLTMKKTLALIHVALMWSREPLTLSDLLRLVNEGHVPYVNAHQDLPDQMKVAGKGAMLFKVETVPSHQSVYKEAQALVLFLQLPAFPPISGQVPLHPALLSLRYLTDANLPDDLHPWVCQLMEHVGMQDEKFHTFNPGHCSVLPRHDVLTAAFIIITMKFLFGLDDRTEWEVTNKACLNDDSGEMFNLRSWYQLVQTALTRAQSRREEDAARRQWKPHKPIYFRRKDRCWVTKKKRIAEQVQLCFEKLSSRPAGIQDHRPSTFGFCWGDGVDSDGPALHHARLAGILTQNTSFLFPSNGSYWHSGIRDCSQRNCSSHYPSLQSSLPRSFVFLLELFSFLLDVAPSYLFEEVLAVERKIFETRSFGTKIRQKNSDSALLNIND